MKNSNPLFAAVILALGVLIGQNVMSQQSADTVDSPVAPTAENDEDLVLPAFTPLRGTDLAIRALKETEFSEKTSRIPIETYRDEDFGMLTYVTKNGSIAAVPQPSNFEVRILPFEEFYEAVRFSPVAGASWRMNMTTSTWDLIEETEPVPAGDYDIKLFHVSDTSWGVIRIDRLTGKTWTIDKNLKWKAIREQVPANSN